MPKQHLTDAVVRKLPVPPKGSVITYNEGGPVGFGCRVTANDARAYVIKYRTRTTRIDRTHTIGAITTWRFTEARAEARKLKMIVDQGGDPSGKLREARDAPDMAKLCVRFEAEHLPKLRPSTRLDYTRLLKNHILPGLGERTKIAALRFADVDRLHRRITDTVGGFAANRTVAVISKALNLAIKWEWIDRNPCRGIEKNPEPPRRRYLSGEELVRLTVALAEHHDQQASDILRTLLMTGARRGEVLSMKWADLNLGVGTWTKPASSTKQKREHSSPLSAPTRQLLSEIRESQAQAHPQLPEYVFVGRYGKSHRRSVKRNFEAILKAANIEGLRLHDLRHSFASQLVSSGHSLELIGSLLGHANAATTMRYAHLYDSVERAAVEKIGVLVSNAGMPGAEVRKIR